MRILRCTHLTCFCWDVDAIGLYSVAHSLSATSTLGQYHYINLSGSLQNCNDPDTKISIPAGLLKKILRPKSLNSQCNPKRDPHPVENLIPVRLAVTIKIAGGTRKVG